MSTPRRAGGNNTGRRRTFGNIRRLPSRRFQASYLTPDGTGRRVNAPTTFQTKTDAGAWLSMQQAAITEGRWKPEAPRRATTLFGEYATSWLTRRELKPRTRVEYGRTIGRINDTFATVPLGAIDAAMIRDWYATLDPAKPTRRAHMYSLLRTIMGTAVEEELLDINPCQIRRASKAKRAREIRPATEAELSAIRDHLPAQWAILVDLGALCGLRFGEATSLRRSDVDLVAGVIRVRRSVGWVAGEPVEGTPKSVSGVRTVAIPPHMLDALKLHLDVYAGPGADGLVLTAKSDDGRNVNHGTITTHWNTAREAAGRPDLRIHDLRHTGASWTAQNGASVRELQEWLGHSTPTMSLYYVAVSENRRASNASRMPEIGASR